MNLLSKNESSQEKIVKLPSLKEIAEYNGDVIIVGGDFGEDTDEARIKRMEIAAKEKVKEAEQQAALIISNAQTEAEYLKKEATERGFQEGKTLGKSEYEALMLDQKNSFSLLADNLNKYRNEMFDDIKKGVTETILYLANRILHYYFDKDDAVINGMIDDTVQQIKDQTNIEVRVSQLDLEKLDISVLEGNGVRVISDERLKHGDIKISCDAENIDISLDGQLERLAEELKD